MIRLSRVFRNFSIEQAVANKIKQGLGANTQVEVIDLSGGCGTMLHIKVASDSFEGKSTIVQHRMVNKCIEGQDIHGFKLETSVLKSP
ncbi:unnamed protein product [Blepharisma stoltei]|uniref:BolA-like protein 3 n=1 Tax=Blepharisma stoltei TaxID=1481888 RepID=A0AAU9JTL1_9CILI|nr:unnamed protein product [Blepharisma stoltei]